MQFGACWDDLDQSSQYILLSYISSRLRCCTVHRGVICWVEWIEHHGVKSISLSLSPCCLFPLSTPPNTDGACNPLRKVSELQIFAPLSLCFSSLYRFPALTPHPRPTFSITPTQRSGLRGEVKYAEPPLEVRVGRVAMKAQVQLWRCRWIFNIYNMRSSKGSK